MRKQKGIRFKIKRREGEKRIILEKKGLNKTPANVYTLGLNFLSVTHFKDMIKYVVNKDKIANSSLNYAKLIFPLVYNVFKPGNKRK